MSDIFINQTYKVYQSNQSIQFSDHQVDFLRLSIAKFIYQQYIATTGDIIHRYHNYQAIYDELDIKLENISQSKYNIHYIIIKGPFILKNLFIFINTNQNNQNNLNSIILSRLVNLEIKIGEYFLKLLENLPDLNIPWIIQNCKINNIESIINKLFAKISSYGDFIISYNLNHFDINSNLRKIKLTIPEPDLKNLNLDQQPILSSINQFLYSTTKIKFENLSIVEFYSGLINIINDGKFRINGEKLLNLDDNTKKESVWLIIESLVS